MITEEELERVNQINKELHDIECILNVTISKVSNFNTDIIGGYENHNIPKNIQSRLNNVIKSELNIYKKELSEEYNKIIEPK